MFVDVFKDQTVENQLLALRDWADGRGHEVVGECVDEGISGRKDRDKRPGLDSIIKATTLGKLDMVVVMALGRFGRSLQHLAGLVAELEPLKVVLFVRNLAVDTYTPDGQLMVNVMGTLANINYSSKVLTR
ncbi:recombinase family protein [Sessilibacter corallicola]|uniref:recombinase family protein n=1 Tax=Sessilibacter corallicola TaxID=2904075 RepID=UPI001E37CE88|nr:recombinase family protein [Sessilibacter corallicola]